MRPPQLRCVFFSSMYLPHLLVLPATFWTSVPFATLSVFPSLICGSCPSGQRFAYSFFQIPSHGGHPCCSAMCFVVAYAHLGLSPIRKRPCWANKTGNIQASARHSRSVKYGCGLLIRVSIQHSFLSCCLEHGIRLIYHGIPLNRPCKQAFPIISTFPQRLCMCCEIRYRINKPVSIPSHTL